MNPAALLPHEKVCPECRGLKTRLTYGAASSSGPCAKWLEPCPNCDGCGVVIIERRSTERGLDPIDLEFTRLRNDLALEHATVVHQADQIDSLIKEVLRQRETIDKAARGILNVVMSRGTRQ